MIEAAELQGFQAEPHPPPSQRPQQRVGDGGLAEVSLDPGEPPSGAEHGRGVVGNAVQPSWR